MSEFCLRSQTIILPDRVASGFVHVRGEKIAEVRATPPKNIPVEDLDDLVLSPGIVDTHAHLNQPGREEWEGFETATRAAASGGITTLVDMPLNCIPATTTRSALEVKRQSIKNATVDYAFWGGLVPDNLGELESLMDAGVVGFKAFLIDSGVKEFPHVDEKHLLRAMPYLSKRRYPLLVHAELDLGVREVDGSYQSYLESRPDRWEVEAIRMVINLSKITKCHVHIVHLSTAEALSDIERAKQDGVPITVETCPHYLLFDSENILDRATEYKCAPPIRGRANREKLWHGLHRVDCIVSDHSPCLPSLKHGDFRQAWGGIAGLQFSLPAMWSEGEKRGISLCQLSRWMSLNTAKLAGLLRKGGLFPGRDADMVAWDQGGEAVMESQNIFHRHPLTPYQGKKLKGVVKMTWLRGKKIFDFGKFTEGLGREIRRGE